MKILNSIKKYLKKRKYSKPVQIIRQPLGTVNGRTVYQDYYYDGMFYSKVPNKYNE